MRNLILFQWLACSAVLLAVWLFTASASGHGFELTLVSDGNGNPTGITETSAQTITDDSGNPIGPNNLFIDAFDEHIAGGIGTNEGFSKAANNFPADATYTFNITSPLYFSSGTGATTAFVDPTNPEHIAGRPDASAYIQIYDLAVVSNSRAYVYGNQSFGAGFAVTGTSTSPPAQHELQKILFNSQADGEYGFAFNVTAHLAGGASITSEPLVDVFATPDFTDNATQDVQNTAALQDYDAIMQGDFNLDGQKTVADVQTMLSALADLPAYQSQHNNMNALELEAIGDVDGDSAVTNADIQGLLSLLANEATQSGGASIQAVPEPSAILLTGLGIALLALWRYLSHTTFANRC